LKISFRATIRPRTERYQVIRHPGAQTPRAHRPGEAVLTASYGVKISVVEILRDVYDDTRGRKIQLFTLDSA